MKRCPECKSTIRRRIQRGTFLKMIPFLKAYRCEDCYTKYVWIPTVRVVLKDRKNLNVY